MRKNLRLLSKKQNNSRHGSSWRRNSKEWYFERVLSIGSLSASSAASRRTSLATESQQYERLCKKTIKTRFGTARFSTRFRWTNKRTQNFGERNFCDTQPKSEPELRRDDK